MVKFCLILFTAGLLIDRSWSYPLNKVDKDSETKVGSKRNAQFRYFSQLLYDVDMKTCGLLESNEHMVKDVLKYITAGKKLTSGYCKDAAITSKEVKAAVLKHFHLEDNPESERAKIVRILFDMFFNMWCEFLNNENFPPEQILTRIKAFNLGWESVFDEKYKKLNTQFNTIMKEFEQFTSKHQSQNRPVDESRQPMNKSKQVTLEGKENKFELFSQAVVEFGLNLCTFLKDNEDSIKELYVNSLEYLLEMSKGQCKNASETSRTVKAAVLNFFNLTESIENEHVKLLWTPFELLVSLWCEVINNENFSLEELWNKTKPALLTWETILTLVSSYLDQLKLYLFA